MKGHFLYSFLKSECHGKRSNIPAKINNEGIQELPGSVWCFEFSLPINLKLVISFAAMTTEWIFANKDKGIVSKVILSFILGNFVELDVTII